MRLIDFNGLALLLLCVVTWLKAPFVSYDTEVVLTLLPLLIVGTFLSSMTVFFFAIDLVRGES